MAVLDPAAMCHYLPFMPSAETQFTPANASAMAQRPRKPKGQRSFRQLLDFQDNLHARLKSNTLTDAAAAQVARAWKELEALRMEKLGVGKPRPVPAKNDPGAKPKSRSTLPEPIGLKPEP